MRRVVVTGLGMVTPLASGVEETWSRILDGQSGAGPITRFDASNVTTKYACEVPMGDGSDGTQGKGKKRSAKGAGASAKRGAKKSGEGDARPRRSRKQSGGSRSTVTRESRRRRAASARSGRSTGQRRQRSASRRSLKVFLKLHCSHFTILPVHFFLLCSSLALILQSRVNEARARRAQEKQVWKKKAAQ